MAARVSAQDFDEKVLKASGPVLVDFYSDSCLACKKLSATLYGIEEEYEGRMEVFKLNTIYDMDVAEKFDVMSNPTLILFDAGVAKGTVVGAKSENEIKEWIDSLI